MLPIHLSTTTRSAIKILLFFIAIVVVQIKTPPVTNAQQSANNTAVFSGQFIPAFVGSAYDPTAAYQRMAGLPVYVFAYDSWGGASFIINNLAVRTQIRADGSFQAQGLPNGQKFGVYFPFKLKDDGTTVVRTDCDGSDDNDSAPTCQNTVLGKDVAFRMPAFDHNVDRIADVFSYNIADATALQSVRTQLDEPIRLGLTFLTQETRVDIANNINTFPLVPTTTLKITSKQDQMYAANYPVSLFEESAYEVVARRIWFDQGYDNNYRYSRGDNLTIRGRTTFPLEAAYQPGDDRIKNDRTFMSYAPPGVYAVTVWRNDGGINYQNYDPVDPDLNSMFYGFGIMRVDKDGNADGTIDAILDWSNQFADPRRNDIPIQGNRLILWGRVFEPLGRSWPLNTEVSLFASQNLTWRPKQRNNTSCMLWVPFTQGGRAGNHPGNGNCGTDPQTAHQYPNLGDPTEAGFQTYAFFENFSLDVSDPRAIVLEPFISEPDKDNTPTQIPLFLSTKGPVQQDLTVQGPPTSGVRITVTSNNLSLSNIFPSKHAFYAQVIRPDNTDTRTIPALKQQFYVADASGVIYIPHGDLVPLEGDDLATNPLELVFLVYGADESNPYETSVQDYTGALLPINDVQLQAYQPKPTEGFKLLGLLPARRLMPGANYVLAATATHADFTVQFANAKAYQELTAYNSRGNAIFHYDAEQLQDIASNNGTILFPLLYQEPTDSCVSATTAPEICEAEVDKLNTKTFVVTADGTTLSETVVVRKSPEQGFPIATPNSWTADFRSECEVIKDEIMDEIEQEKEQLQSGMDLTDLGGRLGAGLQAESRKLTEGILPYMGCNISLRFSNIVSKGLQSFHELLILEPLTVSIAVTTTWNLVRGVANVLFVFILLIIGINHTLGYDIKNWGANVMLPEVIKGIVFANLSLLIVQAILDVNNILTSWIFAIVFDVLETTGISANAIAGTGVVGGAFAVSSFFGGAISSGIATAIAAIGGSGGTLLIPLIGVLISGVLMLLGFLITLFGIFFGRYLIIWVLTITAPLFFALAVLPWFRSMRNMWIKTVIPVATMQTVASLFIAIGILMLSKSAEADGLLIQAGIFLIGGGSLFLSIKSPSLTAQFLGGGGLAGQAFGAIQGLSKGLGSWATQKAGAVSDYTSLENVEERREQKRNRATQREIRDQRHEEKYGKKPSLRSRFVNTITDNRYAEQLEARDKKLSDQVAKRGKLAEQTALGPKFDILNDPKLQKEPQGLRDRFRGQRYRGQEAAYQKNYAPSVHVMTKTGMKPKEFEAIKTGIDANAGVNTNWGNAVMRDADGNAIKDQATGRVRFAAGTSTPKTFEHLMSELHAGDTFKGLQVDQDEIDKVLGVRNMKDFEGLDKDIQARVMEEIKLRSQQNAPGTPANQATGTPQVLDIGQFVANGRRRARQYDDVSSIQASSSGGGGTSRSGGRTP